MTHDDQELVKQTVEGDAAAAHPQMPPPAQAPDVAETMRLLERVSRLPEVRFEKVQEMRHLIAEGKLETPERIDGTIRRLAEELGLLP
jgi:negative regulator of flagellin synthesis FlgM